MNNTALDIAYVPQNKLFYVMFCLWAYFQICRPQDLFVFLQPFRLTLILFLIVSILYLFKNNSNNTISRNTGDSKQIKYYHMLLAVSCFSILFSYYRRASFDFFFFYYLQTFLFFVFFIYIIDSIRRVESLILICCIGIGLYSLWSLAKGVDLSDRFSFGEMFDPNDLAYLVISFVMFNLIMIKGDFTRIYKLLAIACIAAGFILILKTGSRGGAIAFVISLALLFFSKRRIFPKSTRWFLLIGILIYILFSGEDFSRYKSLSDINEDYNVTDETGRVQIWKLGMGLMLTRPLTGVGLNCFPEAIGRDRETRDAETKSWQTAHNSLVQIGTETGVLGFILFAVMSIRALKLFHLVRVNAVESRLMMIAEIAFISFAGNLVASMFLSQAYSIIWAFYIALSVVLPRLLYREMQSDSARQIVLPNMLSARTLEG